MRIFLVLAFVLAASAGSATAQSFEEVQAARGDYATAFRGFQQLAEQGNVAAQYCLGGMYCFGEGVPQHFLRAHMWMNLAASRLTGEQREKVVE